MKFKLKKHTGNHTQKVNGILKTFTYNSGEIIESDVDLSEKFPNKFEKVLIAEIAPNIVQKAVEKPVEDLNPPKEDDDFNEDPEEEEIREPLGKDVTSKIKIAIENDFKVFYKKGKGYFVAEADDEFIALNKKGLKKEKVEDFIENHLE